jgi:hypothetical protein
VAAGSLQQVLSRIEETNTWDERVEEIRRIPEKFGTSQHQSVYAAVAEAIYAPHLAANFAHVLWTEKYEPPRFEAAYRHADRLTEGFTRVTPSELASTLREAPTTLLVFRTIIGYRQKELAVAATEVAKEIGTQATGDARVNSIEGGSVPSSDTARTFAETIHRLINGTMWEAPTGDLRSKLDKPDTGGGWSSVQKFAKEGVPYHAFLHQRHYGGAFRTLLDATSAARGEALLEEPVETLLTENDVPHIKTGSHDQAEIASRFNITVKPAPDFVIFEDVRTVRALIECKQANDGGTARDKASRFGRLAQESNRLGGVPLVAVLDGLGWQRTNDALGPVIRDTAGRVFSIETLPEMLTVQPFPGLIGKVAG